MWFTLQAWILFHIVHQATISAACKLAVSVVTGVPTDERFSAYPYGKSGLFTTAIVLKLECEDGGATTDQVKYELHVSTSGTPIDGYDDITSTVSAPKHSFYVKLGNITKSQTDRIQFKCRCDGVPSAVYEVSSLSSCYTDQCKTATDNVPCYQRGAKISDLSQVNSDIWDMMEKLQWNKDSDPDSDQNAYRVCRADSTTAKLFDLSNTSMKFIDRKERIPYAITNSTVCHVRVGNRTIPGPKLPPIKDFFVEGTWPCINQQRDCYYGDGYCTEASKIKPPRFHTAGGTTCYCWGCDKFWSHGEANFHTHGREYGGDTQCRAVDSHIPWCYTANWMHEWDYCWKTQCTKKDMPWEKEYYPPHYFDPRVLVFAYWNPFPMKLERMASATAAISIDDVFIGSIYYATNDLHIIPNERGCTGRPRKREFQKDIECSLYSWTEPDSKGRWPDVQTETTQPVALSKINTQNNCVDKFLIKIDDVQVGKTNLVGCSFFLNKYKDVDFEDPRTDFPDRAVYQTYFYVVKVIVKPEYDLAGDKKLFECKAENIPIELVESSHSVVDVSNQAVGNCLFDISSCNPVRVHMKVNQNVPFKSDATLPPTPTTTTTAFRTNPPFPTWPSMETIDVTSRTAPNLVTVPLASGQLSPVVLLLVIFCILFVVGGITALVFGVCNPRKLNKKLAKHLLDKDESSSKTARHHLDMNDTSLTDTTQTSAVSDVSEA